MRSAPPAGAGFSPLDEELALLPGRLSPWLQEALAHLGTWLAFRPAAQALALVTGVAVSASTARRLTEAAGAAAEALETAEVERIEREHPPAPLGPALQQVSVDGAMAPLRGGTWGEVRTLAIGTVESRPGRDGGLEPHAEAWSYFSRLAAAERFTRLALGEVQRRGVETAGRVVAPVDGSGWCQSFLDVHRPDAVRILDFPHAVSHLSEAAQATWGEGAAEAAAWLQQQAHTLKAGDPEAVLDALRALPSAQAAQPTAAEAIRAGTLSYLETRRSQIASAQFRAQGYPIGSGSIESANKLLMQARLKGAGMHWAPEQVNALLALRGIVCSDRWPERWPQIAAQRRAQLHQRRTARWRARHPQPPPPPPSPPLRRAPARPLSSLPPASSPTVLNGRPTAQHPWKQRPLLAGGRAHAETAKM